MGFVVRYIWAFFDKITKIKRMAIYCEIVFGAVIVMNILLISCVDGLFEFQAVKCQPTQAELRALESIPDASFQTALTMGVNSVDSTLSLENSLSLRGVLVQNGSISHRQLIETLSNRNAQGTNTFAKKILKASLYLYNTECIQRNVEPDSCAQHLSTKEIPSKSKDVKDECSALLLARKDENHVYRRLLPSNYKDGFYMMNDKLTSPWELSYTALHGDAATGRVRNSDEDIGNKNLALIQWAQFIEHDLSKPVVSTLNDGQPIECCGKDNLLPAPRDLHPSCAPLLESNPFIRYRKRTCLNYVRSALSLEKCNFGPAQQLNQATGYLDLSHLYGFTRRSQRRMRSFVDGRLKTSYEDLLPLAEGEKRNSFCAFKSEEDEICFAAGDSRVNSNPYSIILYTIFLRSHNSFADATKAILPKISDESLFRIAKKLNIDLYRKIVFNEWLPVALGQQIAEAINSEELAGGIIAEDHEVSNEFAVAAIRFYFSMMPNVLRKLPLAHHNESTSGDDRSDINPPALFILIEQMFRSVSVDRASKVNEALSSMLNQRALKIDFTYADSVNENNTKMGLPILTNILAFDIQRGRDHGLQGYVKYLEQCKRRSISTWDDLRQYITPMELRKLKSMYNHIADIDLIVGGISELPETNSTVGPTFTCILGEQFSKIRQWHHNLKPDQLSFDVKFKNITAAELICAHTGIKEVPQNIFLIPSDTNPLLSCSDVLRSTN